ncbi:MAG: hypothetical protein ACT4QF_04470 [Sporichthyaceae bacterium]
MRPARALISVALLLPALAACGGDEPDVTYEVLRRDSPPAPAAISPTFSPTTRASAALGSDGRLKVCVKNTNFRIDDTVSASGPVSRTAKLEAGTQFGAEACTDAWEVPAGLYRVLVTREESSCLNNRLTVRRDGRQVFGKGGEPGGAERFLPYEAKVGKGESVELEVVTSCEP